MKIDKNENRLSIGDRVIAKSSLVDWYSSHLCCCYGRVAPKDEGYRENEKEIDIVDLESVYVWSLYRLVGDRPKGYVTRFGSKEDDSNRRSVYVQFVFQTELGDIKHGTYVAEKDLVKLVKKKKKK